MAFSSSVNAFTDVSWSVATWLRGVLKFKSPKIYKCAHRNPHRNPHSSTLFAGSRRPFKTNASRSHRTPSRGLVEGLVLLRAARSELLLSPPCDCCSMDPDVCFSDGAFVCNLFIGSVIASFAFAKGSSPAPAQDEPSERDAFFQPTSIKMLLGSIVVCVSGAELSWAGDCVCSRALPVSSLM